ncbi:MAG: DNA mismatch repair endonuclease MutL [Clostridia bacterium]|nr:DNA mismatch repair endonuclease MutL [Clostridia bacterium]
MSLIHVLNPEISNKIAAGEVVERPASVVKELVENSIDAGSTRIVVEIKNGGASLISVEDNGCGMAAEDAQIAFLRHATSKISTAEDLEAIYTLGFRGEALSSIGAVSKAAIYTKRSEDSFGTVVTCDGGEIIASEEGGMSDGTKIVVRNLFYNTPARMKFLKKDATEAGYVADVVTRFILAHPEISFRLIKNGKDVLFSSGDGNLVNAVYSVYGRDYAKSLISVDYEYESIRVTGAVGKGNLARPNRNFQSFFVNGRYIKSPLIIRAVEEAYKNQIMIGKFPVAIINISVNPSFIDINVHPTKLEVKFSEEKQIYDGVYYGVKNALYALPNIPEIETKHDPRRNPFMKERTAVPDLRSQVEMPDKKANTPAEIRIAPEEHKKAENTEVKLHAEPKPEDPIAMFRKKEADTPLKVAAPEMEYKAEVKHTDDALQADSAASLVKPEPAQKEIPQPAELPQNIVQEAPVRIAGCVFDTYIVAERGNEMLLIDQHAAHERIKYEQLIKSLDEKTLYPQMLIEPVIVRMTGAETAAFEANSEVLSLLGFEADLFGENEAIVRTSPQDVEIGDVEDLYLELLSELAQSKKEILPAKRQRLIYTIACKAAVKANQTLTKSEMESLVSSVLALKNINTCPHGRPIMISMTKKELEKQFKRIV